MKKLLLAGIALLISACGFHLKGTLPESGKLPAQLWQIVDGGILQEPLHTELSRQSAQISGDADAAVEFLSVEKRRDIQSISRIGTINEYRLVLLAVVQPRYRGEAWGAPFTIRAQRDFSYSDSEILGKSEEEDTLWEAMGYDAAQQIVLRLRHLPPAPQQ